MPKPSLSPEAVQAYLQDEFGGGAGPLQRLIEGEESQAFWFPHGGQSYVLRINPSLAGFQKDDFAHRRFHSKALPIPAVIRLGWINSDHAFCISEMAPGTTLQALAPPVLEQSLAPTLAVWEALGRVDISTATGWGDFDTHGRGQFASWHDYLRSVLDPQRYRREAASLEPDRALLHEVTAAFVASVPHCPETRQLVHGDFGSNNVLYEAGRVSAVLDWDSAKYGDAVYDLAGAYYWRTWLGCMEALADYCEQRLGALPNYRERIACYQLRIGLDEIYGHAAAGDRPALDWHQHRCREVLRAL